MPAQKNSRPWPPKNLRKRRKLFSIVVRSSEIFIRPFVSFVVKSLLVFYQSRRLVGALGTEFVLFERAIAIEKLFFLSFENS